MNSLLEQLQDIEGIDPISWWPLAIGWWFAIGLGALLTGLLSWWIVSRLTFKRSWKNDALKKLTNLEKNLSNDNARDSLIILSDYLRRIVLKRFSRKECAGLTGDAWLKWLMEHDLHEFDWVSKGLPLVQAPYAPKNISVSSEQIKDLIQAVRNWVR